MGSSGFASGPVVNRCGEDSPALDKAKVTLVVRSFLEQAHRDGPLHGGIVPATQYAAGPLSHLLAARRRQPGATLAGIEALPHQW